MPTAKPTPSAPAPKPRLGSPALAPMTFDLRQPLIVLRAHFWVAAALVLIVCTLVGWQQMRQPRLFSATATLVLDRAERNELMERGDYGSTEMAMLTSLEQLRSPGLLQRVIASLTAEERGLAVTGYADAAAARDAERTLKGIVRPAVSFARKEGTMLIMITAVHRDPAAGALLANRFAEQAIRYAVERRGASNDASLAFLREQAEEVRKKAEAAELQLQEYRQKYNLVSLEANQNIIVDNLKSLNASATAARVARVAIEARMEQADIVVKRGDGAEQIAAITGSTSLADIARQLADLRGKRAVMAERYGRHHPLMQENQRVTGSIEKLLDEELKNVIASLRDQRDKALSEERQLDRQRAAAEKAALDLDQLGVEYNTRRRAVESYRSSYSQILARLNDAAISSQLRGVSIKISELASPPAAPFSPNLQRTLLIVAGLALAILIGYPFAAEMFFGRIRSASDVEHHLGLDLLGEIGSVRGVAEKDRPFLVKSENDLAVSEQFNGLFSQLSLSSKIDPPKAILITSTVPGEGKSFIAANLAHCFAAHSRRTLLVDADLRRPVQHRQFGLDNQAGLVRWLEEGGAVGGDLLQDAKLGLVEINPGLHLLRAGGLSRKASELMDAGRLTALFAALQKRFDVLIVDTPPAGVFPDAISFAKVCHELIYICRFNVASRQSVRDVAQRLKQTGLEFPGIVLNAMPSGFAGSYYYKGYGYYSRKAYTKHYQQPKG
jgi:capsular exopolysaccharide synthesis family protein